MKEIIVLSNPAEITARAPGQIVLHGAVGAGWEGDGFTARDVIGMLAGKGDVVVRLNSAGGLATEGAAIHAVLAAHPGRVIVRVEGLAASAASLLAMAADEIVMAAGALLMIHDPSGLTIGPADAHRKSAADLDKLAETYAAIYAARSGRDPADVRELMLAETWLTAQEAVAAGFADRAETAPAPAAAIPAGAARLLSQFGRTPPELLARAARAGGAPAAPAASPEIDMQNSTAAAPSAAPSPAPAPAVTGATATAIREAAARLKLPPTMADTLIAEGLDLDAARARMIDAWAAAGDTHEYGARPAEGPADPRTAHAAALGSWLRGEDPRATGAASLAMVAKDICRRAGLRPWDDAEAIRMAHTTSDFPVILENSLSNEVARRVALRLPDLARVSHEIARDDYRAGKLVNLSASSAPEEIAEGGEIKHVTAAETGEALPTPRDFGAIFKLSVKALINDSTAQGLLNQMGQRMAEGAVERLRAVLVAPLNDGQNLADGNAVFHSSRGNLAASGAAPSVDTLSAAVQAMRLQKGAKGELLAVEPRFIVVHPKLETLARQLVAEITPVAVDAVNPFSGRLDVVVEPALADEDAWYLAADPAAFDGLAHTFLDGGRAPRIQTREGWETLGYEWRLTWALDARFVAAASWFKNPGA